MSGLSGCAGVFGGYGPGMTDEARTNTGCSPDYPGATMGTCSTTHYESGEHVLGAQLGARVGAVNAKAGSIKSGTGTAVDAHVDFTYATAKWGAGLTGGYTSDRLWGTDNGGDMFFSGFPIAAYGQYGLARRFFVHGGLGRVIYGSVKRIEPNETSVDASAWRAFAGITYVFSRSDTNDFALRLEVRTQKSSTASIDSMDATWSSTGLLGEIVWATF